MKKHDVQCKNCGATITGVSQKNRITGHVCYPCKKEYHRKKSLERSILKRNEINLGRREKRKNERTHL